MEFNNFLKSRVTTSKPNGFEMIVLFYDIVDIFFCAIFEVTVKFTLNCTEIQNVNDVMSDPPVWIKVFSYSPQPSVNMLFQANSQPSRKG